MTPATEDPYLLLKTTSHFSISLYEILEQANQGKISLSDLMQQAEQLHKKINHLKENYSDCSSSVWPIVDLILSSLDKISSCTNSDQLKLINALYLSDLKPSLDKFSEEAAALQLSGLHHITKGWLKKYPIDLKTTYTVIVGARGPKKNLVEHQFFTALRTHYGLEEKNTPTGGIIYSEMLPQQMTSVTMEMLVDDLARDVHNMQIGLGVLGDRGAMSEDVLGKYAPPILDHLMEQSTSFPQESKCPCAKIPKNINTLFHAPEKTLELKETDPATRLGL